MSSEEDSYYPEMTIEVDEEVCARLKERVPGGLIRPYIEELVKYAAGGSTATVDKQIFETLRRRAEEKQRTADRVAALENELRRLKGTR